MNFNCKFFIKIMSEYYIKYGYFFILDVSKFNILKTKKGPEKNLRRLPLSSVVCFVSQGGDKI